MAHRPLTSRLTFYTVLAGAGALLFGEVLQWLTGAESMAALVAVRLCGVGLAIGLSYLIAPRTLKAEKIDLIPISKRASLTGGIAGLAAVVAITVWSHDWWLAVEMLVIFAIMLLTLFWWTLKLRDGARAG
jgi:hypothetical protein